MSERAEQQRLLRKKWASSGSNHDRLVRGARTALPLFIGLVGAILIFSPFSQRNEISFLLSKDKVEVAKERMRVTQAEYRGQDNKGQAFSLIAGSAVQKSSEDPVVLMDNLAGSLILTSGPATIAALTGAYNMDREEVRVPGLVKVRSAQGYVIDANNVAINLDTRSLKGEGGVNGALNLGKFSANQMEADLDERIVRLTGNARLRINQGVLN